MSGVDVLETMDADRRAVEGYMATLAHDHAMKWRFHLGWHDEARAAVAELIEATKQATEERLHDGASSRAACDRLVAALARVTGGAA